MAAEQFSAVLREAAKKVIFFSGPGRGKALLAGPLKRTFFCVLPNLQKQNLFTYFSFCSRFFYWIQKMLIY